jgi:hypothetical protein
MLAAAVAACDVGSGSRPVPSVSQIGADLKCTAGDHPFEDNQLGWGFCYPGTWRYIEKANSTASPSGLDLTFDITNDPCVTPSAAPNTTPPPPSCGPDAGLFGYMIVSTYSRGDSASLASWVQSNLHTPATMQPIAWGNALDAARLSDGRRIALSPHQVVILDLHGGGVGNIDLESLMSARLGTWRFSN